MCFADEHAPGLSISPEQGLQGVIGYNRVYLVMIFFTNQQVLRQERIEGRCTFSSGSYLTAQQWPRSLKRHFFAINRKCQQQLSLKLIELLGENRRQNFTGHGLPFVL